MILKNLVSGKELLNYALKNKIAIGAFNFSNLETIQSIVNAANETSSPVILQASESAIKYMGFDYISAIIEVASKVSNVPISLHLDHGKNLEICKKCIEYGFTSIMIDNSSLPFEDNIKNTKEVVDYAKKYNVCVEAELGTLAGIEDEINISSEDSFFTDPNQALEFINRTKVDSLAIAIGTSHGPNKGKSGNPKLDIKRLIEIKNKVGEFPLVLHGASSVYPDIIKICNKYGANIKNAHGITDSDIKESIKYGISKINVDTDIRIAFLAEIRRTLTEKPENIDIRNYLGNAKNLAKEVIIRKIKTFSC